MSPAHAGAYSSGFSNAIAPYAFNANQAERGRMMQATEMSPGLAEADYNDINKIGQVGEQQQRMEQTQLQDDVNRWNFGQNIDQNKLRQFMSNISGNYGGTRDTNSTQPVYSKPTSNTLGNIGAAVDIAKSVYTK